VLRFVAFLPVLALLVGCGPDYSPNTYSTNAVQQANKVERGVVVGVRPVLRWDPYPDALSYSAIVFSQKNNQVVFNRSNRKVKGKRITTFIKAFTAACTKAGCPGRIPHDLRRTAVRNLVRAGIPERVAMQMTGHKTRSVFERYNIVSECDLVEAAKKLNSLQPVPPALGRDDGLASTKPRSGEVGHNLGTVGPNRGSRLRVSL